MTAPANHTLAALDAGRYEVAALRLLLGLLTVLSDTAPVAREELIALIAGEAGR